MAREKMCYSDFVLNVTALRPQCSDEQWNYAVAETRKVCLIEMPHKIADFDAAMLLAEKAYQTSKKYVG